MGLLVSVVVITYNHEPYIRQALDSIFSQIVNFSYEVLIADDASSDKTPQILTMYSRLHPEIRLMLRQKNVGATKNGYYAMQKCRGKYLAYLEGDDFWTDTSKLQKQIDFLEKKSDFIGNCHEFHIVNESGENIVKTLNWVSHKKVFTLADFQGIFLPSQPSTYVFRNFFLDKSRDYSFLYKTDRMISDRTHIMFCLSLGNFYCFGQKMSAYRVMSTGITRRIYGDSSHIGRDLILTQKLEVLADELGVDVDFSHHRKEMYASAVICFIKTLDKSNFSILKHIRAGGSRMRFLGYLPIGIWKRIKCLE